MINISIYDNGKGLMYRKYTKDTLNVLYSSSALGANYEVSVLIEGLVFMAILTYYALRDQAIEYFIFLRKKPYPTLATGINKLESFKIFDDDTVISELKKYKEMRNDFIHDPFHMKSMDFNKGSIPNYLENLFTQGMKVLEILADLTNTKMPDWKKRYHATIEGNTIDINLGKIEVELQRRGFSPS